MADSGDQKVEGFPPGRRIEAEGAGVVPAGSPTHRDDLLWAGAMFLLALGARVFAALQTRVITPDGVEFVEIAKAFAAGDVAGALSDLQHPLYPFLVSLAWRVAGDWTSAASAVSALFGGLAAIPLFFLLQRLAGTGPARFAAFAYAFLPSFVRFGADALSESVFHFFLLSAFALASPPPEGRSWTFWKAALAGFFAALAYYARPEAVLILAAVGTWWAARAFARREVRALVLPLAAFVLVFAAAAAPYVLHIRETTGRLDFTMKKPAVNLLNVYHGEQGDTEVSLEKNDMHQTFTAGEAALQVGKSLAFDLFYFPALLVLAGLALPRRRGDWARDLYLLLPVAMWACVCFLLARSHGYLSHRHISPAALLLLGFAGKAAFGAGKAGAAFLRGRFARLREEVLVAGIATALAVFTAVLGSTTAFRLYRGGKAYIVEAGRDLKASEGPGRRFMGNSIRIAYYAEGRHSDIPPFAGFDAVCRTALERRADLFVIDVVDPYFPVRHAEILEKFRDAESPPAGFTLIRRWKVDAESGRERDVRAYRVDREALQKALAEKR